MVPFARDMQIFRNSQDVIDNATALTAARLDSLERDVTHCLRRPYAPLPAIEYCFSTIDLMGALYRGDATRDARTSEQARAYMVDFMKYTDEQSSLLQKIFRHKIVHLAMPKHVIEYKSKSIGWKYIHDDQTAHLKLTKFQQPRTVPVTGLWKIRYEYQFTLSIKDLLKDICNSVVRPRDGYLAVLRKDSNLQANFEKALVEIYDPWQ